MPKEDPELKAKKVAEAAPLDEKKRKSKTVLEAVLNRLLKEQDDLTTPGDLIWKGYLGWSVPKDQVGDVASVPEAMISNRIQRDGGEDKFHITIISPVEVRAIANKIRDEQGLSGGKSKKEAKRQLFLAAAELEGPDYTVGQASSVSGEGDGSVGVKGQPSEAHYKPVMWQAAQRLRAKFGLPPKDLHVTIGIGENGDVHGIEKQ
ncbi:MAG: hypothetical protein ACXABN_16870 [Candidatus Thorarchaeota archaeon]|jgi:hypothetical protein